MPAARSSSSDRARIDSTPSRTLRHSPSAEPAPGKRPARPTIATDSATVPPGRERRRCLALPAGAVGDVQAASGGRRLLEEARERLDRGVLEQRGDREVAREASMELFLRLGGEDRA